MTPKQKAKELVDKFYQYSLYVQKDNAKQCALICVDEILDALYDKKLRDISWIEVKQELLKQ